LGGGCIGSRGGEWGPREAVDCAVFAWKTSKNAAMEDICTGLEILSLTALHSGHHNLSRNQVQEKRFLKAVPGHESL
jgi:hypothetical protein